MLTTVGSISSLSEGKMENLEIHAIFKNLDFGHVDFESQLSEGLQKVREEIMAHRQLLGDVHGQYWPARKPGTYPQLPE